MSKFLSEGYFVLFLIITLGIVIGNFKIKRFSLDLSAVIIVALFLGHFGYLVPIEFQTIGLLFFIFTIGIQAGPGFFDSFNRGGKILILIGIILLVSAASIAKLLGYVFDIDNALAVGIFNGALTSTPGLAAAIEATGSASASIGYGIAYSFGVIGVIIFLSIAHLIFKIDLKKEGEKYKQQLLEVFPDIINRNLIVENKNIAGKTLGELRIGTMTHAIISRVKQQGIASTPTKNTTLNIGDIVKVVGTEEALKKAEMLIGSTTNEEIPLEEAYKVNWVLVTNKKVINNSLGSLNLTRNYNATITRIRRSEIDLTPTASSRLRFGDKVLVACDSENMRNVMKLLGNEEKRLSESNFLPISLGIIIGVLIGSISIPIFGYFDFSLGMTGGVLTTALVLSKIGKTGNIIWSMSGGGNQLLRKLGMLMFLATVGTHAGSQIAGTWELYGWNIVLIGVAITLIPMMIAILAGHYIFKINFLTLLGVIAGSMTSTPGLGVVDNKTESEAPSVAYATVYPMALVLMIIFSKILAIL
ncbi:MAG: transporter [Bacteroidetes bacterium]|nr:transporter [Bacteroidota bacterium]